MSFNRGIVKLWYNHTSGIFTTQKEKGVNYWCIPEWVSRELCLMKKKIQFQRLHTLWVYSYNILERTKITEMMREVNGCQGLVRGWIQTRSGCGCRKGAGESTWQWRCSILWLYWCQYSGFDIVLQFGKVSPLGKLATGYTKYLYFLIFYCSWIIIFFQFLLYSKVTQSYICIHSFSHIIVHHVLTQEIRHSSLCCIVGPH